MSLTRKGLHIPNHSCAASGIGPYTGNAIASIAGNQRVAVVDANVVRVLARLRRLPGDQKSSSMVKLNAKAANTLVDPERPGCFNQVAQSVELVKSNDKLLCRFFSNCIASVISISCMFVFYAAASACQRTSSTCCTEWVLPTLLYTFTHLNVDVFTKHVHCKCSSKFLRV